MANFLFLNIFEGDYVFLRLTSFFVFFILIFVFVALIAREVRGYMHYIPKKKISTKESNTPNKASNKTKNKEKQLKEKIDVNTLANTSIPSLNKHNLSASLDNGGLLIELFVEMQRKSIGMRNVQRLKIGSKMYVGGGRNDEFLIFLVPLPSRLASIEYDGKTYIFKILKPSFFPYEKEREVKAPIGKIFVIVSEKGYHMYITFLPHEILCKNRGFHIKYGLC